MRRALLRHGATIALAAATLSGSAAGLQTGSISSHAGMSAGSGSYAPKLSANGRYIVFVSSANNLVTNDDRRPFLDVFRHDLNSGDTVLVSVNMSGRGGGNEDSSYPDISADGRYIAFVSAAGDLVNNDTNGQADVFVRDVEAGVTTLASLNETGTRSGFYPNYSLNIPLNGNPKLSADGRKVVFDSLLSELTAGDTNGIRDVFLRDLDTGITARLSVGTGMPTNSGLYFQIHGSFNPILTPDAARVAFVTTATNELPRFGNALGEICVRDIVAGQTLWASSNAANFFAPPTIYKVGCTNPALSANGRSVVFQAFTTDMFSPVSLVHHDLDAKASTVITYSTSTRSAPAVNGDGRFVAYEENQLVPSGLYLWDAQTHAKTLISVVSNGTVRSSHSPAITPDGRFVAFISSSSGLVTNEVTTNFQVYVRDIVAGTTRLVSATSSGKGNMDHSYTLPVLSSNGAVVVFDSEAGDLVPDDLNEASDVFVRQMSSDSTTLVSVRSASLPSATASARSILRGGALSRDGRYLLFGMTDGFEMAGDTNHFTDLFVRDLELGTNLPVTAMANGLATTNFTPRNWVLSDDGRYVAYVSAPGLPPFFSSQDIRLLRRDLQAGVDELVTVAPGWLPGLGYLGTSFSIGMSADGNSIAFMDGSTPAQVYVRDMAAGSNRLASVNRLGTGACNNVCTNPVISIDGRRVLFASAASDLVTNVTGGKASLFVRDLAAGTTELVSIGPAGDSGLGYVSGAAFSADGRRIAFVSSFNQLNTIFVRDLVAKTTEQVTGPWVYGVCRNPFLSRDGQHVTFEASADSGPRDVYVRDLNTHLTSLVSVNRFGTGGGSSSSSSPRISPDGRYVVFSSTANNLLIQDPNKMGDVYIRDRWSGLTILVSVNQTGAASGNRASGVPVMSSDGKFVAFQSFASDLTGDDFNGTGDIFVLDLSAIDSDGDGMDDAWEIAYFNNLSRDGTGDFDHDGASDLQEFRSGTDPTNIGSVFQVLTLSRPSGGSTAVLWAAVPGKSYRVQYKTSVSNSVWTDVAGDVTATGSTASRTISTIPAGQLQFFRVLLLQ